MNRFNPQTFCATQRLRVWALGLITLSATAGSAHAFTRIGGIASTPVTQITAGEEHACALTTTGAVGCWGRGIEGQIGIGVSGAWVVIDAPAYPITSGTVAIAAGGFHTCAISMSGGLQCWGRNSNGEIGNGTTDYLETVPVAVSGMSAGVAAVAAGTSHTCALKAAGAVLCWGGNANGQLGNGSMSDSHIPVAVVGLPSGIIALAAGGDHNCVLTVNGAVWCWGRNYFGELGNGGGDSSVPVAVGGIAGNAVAITAGATHTCALTAAGSVQCWGGNFHGQLGNGSGSQFSSTPVTVAGLSSGVTLIGSGESAAHTCAVQNGSLWCWGFNASGQLGNRNNNDSNVPVQSLGLYNGISAVVAASYRTYVLTPAGGVQSWGDNTDGELGNGTYGSGSSSLVPVGVPPFVALDPASIAAGEYHSCTLTKTGTAFCWGDNANGELGIGSSQSQSNIPVIVPNSASLSVLSLGAHHTCGVTTSGGAQCWGYNYYGQLGNGTGNDSTTPVAVSGLSNVSSIAAGLYHTCAMATAGTARCWGYNYYGQLGNGNNTNSGTPVSVSYINGGITGITAGGYHSCTMNSGWFPADCWGYNGDGELGNNTNNNSNTPTFVGNLPGSLTSISSGGYHTCGVTTSGAAHCWGYNGYGELGNGSLSNSNLATPVPGLSSGVSSISAGAFHTCALTTSGAVECWGDNYNGQVGGGSNNNSSTPVWILGGAAAVAAGGFHTCALTTAAGVWCWGYNHYGELGNASTSDTNYPVIAIYAGQSISFSPPTTMAQGASIKLSATASSDMVVSFYTWTPSICSLNGNTLTATSNGLCGVAAVQSGWVPLGQSQFAAAPQQQRVIRIQ